MKRVLFIDYPSYLGHINFNRIYIDSLTEQGFAVKVVVRKNLKKQLGYEKNLFERCIPNFLYQRSIFSLISRVFMFLQLCFVRFFVKSSTSDLLIFSCIDPIVSFFVPFRKPAFYILHSANDVNSSVKRFFLRALGRNNSFIVFNQEMKNALLLKGIKSVLVISHGCPPPFSERYLDHEYMESDLSKRLKGNDFRLLFMPSSNSDLAFTSKLLSNNQFTNFLHENRLLLVINRIKWHVNHPNILILTQRLSESSYRKLFIQSSIILILYPDSFKFKVSGVFFECVANNKKIAVKALPALNLYKELFNYKMQFSTVDELICLLSDLLSNSSNKCIVNGKDLRPNFSALLC